MKILGCLTIHAPTHPDVMPVVLVLGEPGREGGLHGELDDPDVPPVVGRVHVHRNVEEGRAVASKQLCNDWKIQIPTINPLMPKRYFCTTISFIVFKKQMIQGANTDHNPWVSKAHNCVKTYQFPL